MSVPAALPPPLGARVTEPPRVEVAVPVPVGAGTSFAIRSGAPHCVVGAVVESLHAAPASTATTACNIHVRIASPLFCLKCTPRSAAGPGPAFEREHTTTSYSTCRASSKGARTHPFGCPAGSRQDSLAGAPERRLVVVLVKRLVAGP